MKDTFIISERDNVGVRLTDGDGIKAGHKFALCDIGEGEPVIKYGEIIGRATCDIKKGEWVHTHNLRSHLDESFEYTYDFRAQNLPREKAYFRGFRREGRRAGVRNDIYIIPTVGCVNSVCERIARAASPLVGGNLSGIFSLSHQFGCSQLGEDLENIRALLCAIARNPNASFVLFVGLGCENNSLEGIKKELEAENSDGHIAFFNAQEVEDEVEYGLSLLRGFAERAKAQTRENVDFSELCIGLKCGGSDGFSGLTANPLVGKVTDRIIARGGSAVLTEVPEMFGAEQLLMNKCETPQVFERYLGMIENFKKYYTDNGFPVYENPSPGNREGGITTLEEKSLGCVEKAGSTKIVDVLRYGYAVKKAGVSVLDAPGNDLIAATALGAAGCQIVLFTTGRGTPFSTFVPTMKIASNDRIAEKKSGWIDFDAAGAEADALLDLVERTANGEYTCKSEDFREIAFYKKGVTL